MNIRGWKTLLLATVLSLWAGLSCAAGSYPDRPVKIIVGFPAGQATDSAARLLADKLAQSMKQPFVVENRPGQGGSLGLALAARAAPDGYTAVLSATAALATNPHLYKSVGYDALKDFAPSSMMMEIPLVLVAYPSAPFNTLQELVAYAKAHPGKLDYASVGNGTMSHLAMERLKRETGINLVHVPYQGSVRSMTDLIAGNVMLGFDTLTVTMPQVEAGRLKVIAVATEARVPQMPNAPTLIEAGLPGFTVSPWLGLLFPKGTPPEIVEKIHAEVRKAMDDPAMLKTLHAMGAVPRNLGPDAFAKQIRDDYRRWGQLMRASGVQVQ